MKELIIHIGYPRTATKTLQFYLFKKHKDINYLGRFPNREISHHKLINKVLSFSDEEFDNKFDELVNETKALPIDVSKTNLISDEFFLLNDFLYNRMTIEKSIERISKLCKSSEIDLRILFSIRSQAEILKSIFSVTFLTSLKTNSTNLINSIDGMKTDNYTEHFLNSLNYLNLYNKISQFINKEKIHIIIYEKLKQDYINYYEELSNILDISSDETFRLTKDGFAHSRDEMIGTDPNLSTTNQIISFKLKNLKLKNLMWRKNFILQFLNFFKKIVWNKKTKNKLAKKNRDLLNKGLNEFTNNENKIKNYFAASNKKLFQNLKGNEKLIKHYL